MFWSFVSLSAFLMSTYFHHQVQSLAHNIYSLSVEWITCPDYFTGLLWNYPFHGLSPPLELWLPYSSPSPSKVWGDPHTQLPMGHLVGGPKSIQIGYVLNSSYCPFNFPFIFSAKSIFMYIWVSDLYYFPSFWKNSTYLASQVFCWHISLICVWERLYFSFIFKQ